MNKLLVILIFFIGFRPFLNGQSREVYVTVMALADSVNHAFVEKDTAKGISIFNRIEKLYRDNGRRYYTHRVLAEICVTISQVYLKEKKFDSSLHYLVLADDAFLPYKNCGNGILMYKTYLSPFFADHYLATGDTAKALVRLMNFFTERDGDCEQVTRRLKMLLLAKWTNEEIGEEVDRCLRSIRFVDTREYGFHVYLTLFGYTIKKYASGSNKDKKHYKAWYRDHPNFKMLRDYRGSE